MYGTIFSLDIKEGQETALLETMKTATAGRTPEGMVAWFVMKPDNEDNGLGVAIFESKEAHINNANDPKQAEVFGKIMAHLNSDPTWTDGSYVIGEIA